MGRSCVCRNDVASFLLSYPNLSPSAFVVFTDISVIWRWLNIALPARALRIRSLPVAVGVMDSAHLVALIAYFLFARTVLAPPHILPRLLARLSLATSCPVLSNLRRAGPPSPKLPIGPIIPKIHFLPFFARCGMPYTIPLN